MRLNRNTIVLVVASLIIIAAVLVINNTTSTEAPPTQEVLEGQGPLFSNLDAAAIVRLEVNDAEDNLMQMAKDDGGAWTIETATNETDRATSQEDAESAATTFAGLAAVEGFTAENTADFGLAEPAFALSAADAEGSTYVLSIGDLAATAPRYYVQVEGDETVYLVGQADIDALTGLIDAPPYVPPPTPTPTPTATPNPYSEVEMTATAAAEQTLEAESIATETAEAAPAEEDEADASESSNDATDESEN